MMLRVAGLLDQRQVGEFRAQLDSAEWQDGRVTAGFHSSRVKNNQQIGAEAPLCRALGAILVRALEQCPAFISAALPRHVFPPLFNRYAPGMGFGDHVDNAVRLIPGTAQRMRTDLSATVFLNEPQDYDGGELTIADTYGTHSVKLAAGDMILYPASSLHRVVPVTRGVRLAAFFWVQSMVRDDAARSLLHEMDQAIRDIAPLAGDSPALVSLTACYHNLLRRWAEV
jgi:PKHD-type hydroxylase